MTALALPFFRLIQRFMHEASSDILRLTGILGPIQAVIAFQLDSDDDAEPFYGSYEQDQANEIFTVFAPPGPAYESEQVNKLGKTSFVQGSAQRRITHRFNDYPAAAKWLDCSFYTSPKRSPLPLYAQQRTWFSH
jgi:hypothetical protein